jgi:hypothetical protein
VGLRKPVNVSLIRLAQVSINSEASELENRRIQKLSTKRRIMAIDPQFILETFIFEQLHK